MEYSPRICEESVSSVTATPSMNLGDRRMSNGVGYIYIYNAGNSDIPKAGACMPILGSTTGYSCTVTTTSGDFCMGFPINATLTTGTYGWAAANGAVSYLYRTATTTMPSGVRFCMAAAGEILSMVTIATWTDVNGGRTPMLCGQVMGTLASLGTGGIAYINCPSW